MLRKQEEPTTHVVDGLVSDTLDFLPIRRLVEIVNRDRGFLKSCLRQAFDKLMPPKLSLASQRASAVSRERAGTAQ
jgi:hypothetical protein